MLDFSKVSTYPAARRKNKVSVEDFLKLPDLSMWPPILELFPGILQGKDLKTAVELTADAHRKGKSFVFMMGAHLIKNGLSPLIIMMLKKGLITHIATNGAGAIHDFEIAYLGATSEDVASSLEDGTFGMAYETGYYLNEAYREGAQMDLGMGASQARMIKKLDSPHKDYSIFYTASELGIPVTVHTAIGTDIIHQHPSCSGEALGKTSYADFKTFAQSISTLEEGVVMNQASAVQMPEVFLKALTVCRNLGRPVRNFTAVNLDMIDQYRPRVNVLSRPTSSGGRAVFLHGHMEVLLPLFVYGLFQNLGYTFN